jgi:putative ABC transport system substrate-binding protein
VRLPVDGIPASPLRRRLLAGLPDLDEAYDLLGAQAARILRGADASTKPIEQPTRIRATLNLKTARVVGVALPVSLTSRAEIV